ncbi:MAG: Dolichyl-phosphate-mannose-protein mannosyltransferase [Frankiales bacterium]|nr:Dolichyl-phosphate-mannose-protein mannosyltransferase [Frankiales bacterium]
MTMRLRSRLAPEAASPPPSSSSAAVNRSRAVVLALAVAILIPKSIIAWRTYGSNDITHWAEFLRTVRKHGPVGIYGVKLVTSFYNHPPLIGYYLWAIDQLQQSWHISFRFTLRFVSSLSDVGSAVLIFEILRRRRTLLEATAAGILVGLSPVLFVISGYHGNTDPVFIMFTLLGTHLLADRDKPTLAGVAIALAIGVKIVPVVVIPALLVYALVRGRRVFLRFAVGFAVTFAITWGTALAEQFANVKSNVIEYSGSALSQWGLIQLAHWLGDPRWEATLRGSGRFAIVVLCALATAAVIWFKPQMIAEAVGLSLCLFLFLSPAFGTQYLVWGLASAYLISFSWATVYNGLAGILVIVIYTRWSGGLPWYEAFANPLTRNEVHWMFIAWFALGLACAWGIRRIWRTPATVGPATAETPAAEQPATRSDGALSEPPRDS